MVAERAKAFAKKKEEDKKREEENKLKVVDYFFTQILMKYQDFFPFTKRSYLHRAQRRYYFYLSRDDIGFAMVTNMISQLQECFPLRRAAGSFEISLTKWLRGAKTVQLPVTFSMSWQTKKVAFYVGISSVSIKQTKHYMAARGYEFYLRVLKVSFMSER